jgi:hypothetical protein
VPIGAQLAAPAKASRKGARQQWITQGIRGMNPIQSLVHEGKAVASVTLTRAAVAENAR